MRAMILVGVLMVLGIAPALRAAVPSPTLEITVWRVEGTSMLPLDRLMQQVNQPGWNVGPARIWAVDPTLVAAGVSKSFTVDRAPGQKHSASSASTQVALLSQALGTPLIEPFRLRVREEYKETVSIHLDAGSIRPTTLRLHWEKGRKGHAAILVVTTADAKPMCDEDQTVELSKKACRGTARLHLSPGTVVVLPVPQEDGSWMVVSLEQKP